MKKYLTETAKYLLRSQPLIRRYVREINEMYAMSASALRARNERQFLALFRHAYTHSPFYNHFYRAAGIAIDDIQTLADIVRLPVLTKATVREQGQQLLTCPRRGLIANHTSGTTGTPLTVYESWPALWREQAYFVCYRRRCGFRYGAPLISLRGTLGHDTMSLVVHAAHTLYLSSYNIRPQTAERYHRAITRHLAANPAATGAIEAYPSALYNLAVVFRDSGLDCHIPLAFTSSETMLPHQRQLIEQVFHCQLYDHYGTTERTIRLEEDLHHDGYREAPGYAIVEYYPDHTLSTSLINSAFPLIRYKTDDKITLKPTTPRLNESFIKSIDGRAIIYIEGKDGTQYSDSGLTFIFKEVEHMRYAQFVQRERGRCVLNVVPDPQYSPIDEQRIRALLDEKLGHNMDVDIRHITADGLIYGKNNKLALIVRQ